MVESGTGQPAVVLTATAADTHLNWHRVQPEIAEFTRVFSYDRAGLGWSDPSDHTPTPEAAVADLHALLTQAEVETPCVLVGHSVGAIYVRRVAEKYPDIVAGLVLVDPVVENQMARLSCGLVLDEHYQQHLEFLRELAQKSHPEIIATLRDKDTRPFTELPRWLQMQLERMQPAQVAAMVAEYEAALAIVNSERNLPSLGDLPLVVLSATEPPHLRSLDEEQCQQFLADLHALHAELAALSSQGRQIKVHKTGHYIQDECPEAVVDTVREMVEALRQGVG